MSAITPPFESWRRYWIEDPAVMGALARLDSLSARRATGNHKIPAIAPSLQLHLSAAKKLIGQNIEHGARSQPERIAALRGVLAPLLSLERWGRWLYLEHAFEIGSRSGDLLFTALVLRSMGEELVRLHVLQFPEESSVVQFATPEDGYEALWHGLLLVFEAGFASHSAAVAPEGNETFDLACGSKARSTLRDALVPLNDYIHPNFGSHVLAAYPERSSAARLIIESACTVYEAFLSLPWASDALQVGGESLPRPYIVRLSRLEWRISNRILPSITRAMDKGHDPARIVEPFVRWLRNTDIVGSEFVNSDGAEVFCTLRPLIRLPQPSTSGQIAELVASACKDDAFPLHHRGVSLLLYLSMTRRADEALAQARRAGAPDLVVGTAEWLDFAARALHLAITTSLLKLETLLGQTAFQIANENQLGAVLCTRSILEHWAAIQWLLDRLDNCWNEIAKRVAQGKLSGTHLAQIDRGLADFLTGTKGTQEPARLWSAGWLPAGKGSLNILSTLDATFKEDLAIRKVYDITSAMVHGRLMRGVELLGDPKATRYLAYNLFRALVSADEICSDEFQLVLRSQALRTCTRLDNLASVLERKGISPEVLERALLSMRTLKPGRHYTGTGTRENPYEFRDGMPYYESFGRLCEQLGLDKTKRRLEMSGMRPLDIVTDEGRAIYFLAPQPFQSLYLDPTHESHRFGDDS